MDSVNPLVARLTANRQIFFRYAFILQFVAAIPFLWLAYITGKTQASLLLHSKTAPGTVVAVIPFRQYKTSAAGALYSIRTSYDIIVEFNPGDQPVRFQDRRGAPITFTVGSPIRVIYDPVHPLTAIMDRGYRNYLPWAPCAVIGLFLSLVALKGFLSLLLSQASSA